VGILSTKISEVNIKERSLLAQLKEVKNFIISKAGRLASQQISESIKIVWFQD